MAPPAVPTAALERDGIPEAHYRKRWWTLAVLTLSLVMIVMGNSSLNIALHVLQEDLGATNTDLQWMIDGYALVFGGFLLTMGAMGDRFGRKGALQVGLVIFGLAALVAAIFATRVWHVTTLRAIMGFGAALVMPATLSLLIGVFPREERGKAIGIWAAFAGLGGIIGILSSGWLLEHFSWASIFWLNVPIVVIALVGGLWLVPTSRDPNQAPLDIVGSILSVLFLGGILFAIIEGPNEGWTSPLILGTAAAGVLFGVLFILWEKRSPHPMLPLSFFKERGFNAGVTVVTLTFFAMFATFFLLTQYMQGVLAFGPLAAGVRFLPMSLGMILGAPNSDRLVRKIGAHRVVSIGLVLVALGLASFALLDADSAYWRVGVTFFVTGLGMGLSMAPATTVIMSSIPARKAGVGSSMNDTAREVGGAFGIAILGSILKDIYAARMQDSVGPLLSGASLEQAKEGLGRALQVAGEAAQSGDPALAARIVKAAREAFVDGMAPAFLSAGVLVALAAIVVWVYFPRTTFQHPGAPMPQAPGVTAGGAATATAVAPAIALERNSLVARTAKGTTAWSNELAAPARGPALGDGVVAVALQRLGEVEVVAYDVTTGTEAWSYAWDGPAIGRIAGIAASGPHILVAIHHTSEEATLILAHHAGTGAPAWRQELDGRAHAIRAVNGTLDVGIGTSGDTVHIDAGSGRVRSRQVAAPPTRAGP